MSHDHPIDDPGELFRVVAEAASDAIISIDRDSIILFANLWGIALREWKGTSTKTRVLVACGLFLLVASTVVVGYGSYLKVK